MAARAIHFRLLHKTDKEPVKQHMVNPETGDVVESKEVKRGFIDDGGILVMLDDEELDELEPEGSRDIEITRFVPRNALSHGWYERPYWLAPESNTTSYYALADALVPNSELKDEHSEKLMKLVNEEVSRAAAKLRRRRA